MEYVEEKQIVSDSTKEKITNMTNKYSDGLNKRAEAVAKVMVKKPKYGSNEKVYEKYKKDRMYYLMRRALPVGIHGGPESSQQ